jgi:hypothetical protein
MKRIETTVSAPAVTGWRFSAIASLVFAGSFLAATATATALQLDDTDPAQSEAALAEQTLAYADPSPERFGDGLDEIFPEIDEHELNDAWMGMTVVSQEGTVIGYVTDAFIDETGDLLELIVMPGGDDPKLVEPVFVPARFAKLKSSAVDLTLTREAILTLEPAMEYALLVE